MNDELGFNDYIIKSDKPKRAANDRQLDIPNYEALVQQAIADGKLTRYSKSHSGIGETADVHGNPDYSFGRKRKRKSTLDSPATNM